MKNPIVLQYTTFQDPLPDFIYEGIKDFCKNANAYHPQPDVLINKIAKKHNLPKEMIYLTAGLDEAIRMFIQAFGKKTYIFTPTYIVYSEFGDGLVQIPSIKDNDYCIGTKNHKEATLIFLANPNSPCGFTPKERIIELVKNNPQAIVIIDEAYFGFSKLTVIEKLKNFGNMVVFRSFSKDYGMAGNRIAYITASKEIIKKVARESQWANVSYLSVGAAVTALDHEDYFVFPSLINAVLIKFKSEDKGTKFVNFLNKNNFVVSHGNSNSNIGLDKSYVRISIGNTIQMNELKKVIMSYK